MKSRHQVDSSDIMNVFLVGESAGGFVALAAAFTDRPGERHSSTFQIEKAPEPDADFETYSCIPASNDLSRPDLGSTEGILHTGLYNADVEGVASFYGGMLDTTILNQENDTPVIYLFHQGSDVVVNYDYGRVLGRLSWECFAQSNICQSYQYYPYAWGGKGLNVIFDHLGFSPDKVHGDIVENFNYLNNCFSNGHAVDNFPLRFSAMVDLFATEIAQNGNAPTVSCTTGQTDPLRGSNPVKIFPNPSYGSFTIEISEPAATYQYSIYNSVGSVVTSGIISEGVDEITVDHSGLHFLVLFENGIIIKREPVWILSAR
jgi:hypothetical protein